ncbi:MAG: sugar phosphate isomerase/epimerase family protein [Acidobacteriota bacterium]
MRIAITYLYTIFRYGYPHSVADALKSIPEMRKLGFRFLEMEGLGAPFLRALYKNRKQLRQTVDDCGVHVHNFCVVDPDLVSLDAARQAKALDGFKMGAELASLLEAETLHLASYAPPVRYLKNKPYQLGAKGGYRFADGSRIRVPRGFDWNRVWAALVKSCQACADVAAQYGKTVIMEPRVGEVICSVDSMLRLLEHVDRPHFKANFDTAHFCAQRENVVLALMKLRCRFANIHIADNRPVNTDHLPIGDGIIDWMEFFRALKNMGYDGYLGLDLGPAPSLVRDYRKSVERIQSIASRLKLNIEI